jgi:hypothetical protein
MVVASCVKVDAITLSVTKPEHESAAQSLKGFCHACPGRAVLFPIIAVLLFGVSLAWDQLGKPQPLAFIKAPNPWST